MNTHPAEPVDEMLQCFDEQGHPTEARSRKEVKEMPPRWWYAVSRIWLVNGAGQIMCSKRAEGLSGNPGKWQTYFGGHVKAGETIRESARAELAEEAGLSLPLEEFHFIDKGRNEEKNVFFENYAVRFNGQPADLRFTDNEVTEAKWMDMNEYLKDQELHPEMWCNGCIPERQRLIKDWLGLS